MENTTPIAFRTVRLHWQCKAVVFESRFQCGLWVPGGRQVRFSNPDSNADSPPPGGGLVHIGIQIPMRWVPGSACRGFRIQIPMRTLGPWPEWQGFSNPDSNADSGPQGAPVGVFESRFQCGLWAPGSASRGFRIQIPMRTLGPRSACRGFRIQIPMRTLAHGHGGRGFRIQIPMRTLGPRKRQD